MKRNIVLSLLLFALTILPVQTSLAQSRPRRVGQTPPPQQTPSPEPQDETTPTQTARPSQAPVLGGANRNPNEQQPTGQKKDAGPEMVGEGDVVKVDTTLVSIPVAVMDRDGKYVPDLAKENFRIWENGVEQRVAYFASTEKPFTVALVIDTSGSTRFRLEEIQEAAIAFVQQLRPDDKVMVVTFSDRIRVLCQPTNDRSLLQSKLRQIEPGGGTKLYDAVDQVINKELSHVDGRKAIVLFTDGVDTTSKHATYETTVRDAEELDALIYPVEYDTLSDMGIFGPGGGGGGGGWPGGGGGRTSSGGSILDVLGAIINGGGGGSYPSGGGGGGGGRGSRGGRGGGGWPGGAGTSREEYALADRYLHELARVSGARLYNAEQQNLDAAFRSVAEELRRQYSLGYYPKNAPQRGERREIKVRVDRPELVVRTRDSYVFQSGANTAQTGASQTNPPVLKKDLIGKR